MKALITALFALSFLGSAPAIAQTKPSMFPSREACGAAVLSGGFSSYEPKNFKLKGKNPIPGSKVDSLRTERPGCFYLDTFQGWQWVSEGSGTMMLTCNGKICGLAKCWNPAKEFFFPSPPAPLQATASAPMFVARSPDTLVVKFIMSGRLGVDLTGIPPVQQAPPSEPYHFVGEKGFPWKTVGIVTAVVAGGVATYFIVDAISDGKNKSRPPGVTSDSAVVIAKCTATGTNNNCPNPAGVSESFTRFGDEPTTIRIPLLTEPSGPRFTFSPTKIQLGMRIRFRLP